MLLKWWFKARPAPEQMTGDPLAPEEMARVLGSVPDDALLLRAVLQVIGEEMATAQEAAEATVADHGICASEVGGVQHLRRLRERLLELQKAGRQMPVVG